MDISAIPNETWSKLIIGKASCDFNFLALKFFLARLQMKVRKDPQSATIAACVSELKEFLQIMGNMPVARQDIEQISQLRSL